MGFFGDVGNALFGTDMKKEGQAQMKSAGNTAQNVATQGQQMAANAQKQGAGYDAGVKQSMGANAADYMNKANAASQQMASQNAAMATKQATQQNIQAQRTGGMSGAAAAARAGQDAGNVYGGQYQQGQAQGVQNYMAGTQQMAGQGAEMAGRQVAGGNLGLGAAGVQQGVAQSNLDAAQKKSDGTFRPRFLLLSLP